MTGKQLRKKRLAAGLTQAELAQAAGVDRGTILRWEAGKHRPRTATTKVVTMVLDKAKNSDSARKKF